MRVCIYNTPVELGKAAGAVAAEFNRKAIVSNEGKEDAATAVPKSIEMQRKTMG